MSALIDWNQQYKKSAPKLLGICRRYIKDIYIAEDLVHESFIIALEKENSYKATGSVESWMARIVINLALAHLKSKTTTNETNFEEEHESFDTLDEASINNPSEKQSIIEILCNEFSQTELLEAIDKLPIHHKMVFNMYVIDNFSHQQICEALSITLNTSKSHLSRARKKMQEILMEKLENKKEKKSKKRWIAILVFLGLGNHLFAKSIKNSFESFEIQPSRAFEPMQNKKHNFAENIISTKKGFLFYKTKILISIFGTLFFGGLLLLYFTPEINNPTTPEPTIIDNKPKIDIDKEFTETTSGNIKTSSILNNEEIALEKTKTEKKENTIIQTEKQPSNILTKNTDTIPKAIQPVVIVKKKIIKRDTIYVPK